MNDSNRVSSIERASALIRRLVDELADAETIQIGFVVYKLRRRSFGGLFILLALLGLLPGISFFAGLAAIIPATQMALGFRAAVLPRFIRRRRVNADAVKSTALRALPVIERIESYIRPRWAAMTTGPMLMLCGIAVLGLSLIVMLPLPFSNFPPAFAMLLLSLGFLERDGIMVAVGLVASVAAMSLGLAVAVIAFKSLSLFLG